MIGEFYPRIYRWALVITGDPDSADNMTRIAMVLLEFDKKQPEIRLHIDVIEARCGRLTEDEGEWLLFIDLQLSKYDRNLLRTSAMIRDGQTTLVGTTLDGDVKAVILAVRLEIKE